MADDRDTRITASWALGHAYDKHGTVESEEMFEDARLLVHRLDELVKYMVENNLKVAPVPASEASVKYLKSLLMQNGRGQLNGKNIDGFIKEHVEDTQEAVSKLIDEIKTDPKTVGEWLDEMNDHVKGIDDGEAPTEPREPATQTPKEFQEQATKDLGTDVF